MYPKGVSGQSSSSSGPLQVYELLGVCIGLLLRDADFICIPRFLGQVTIIIVMEVIRHAELIVEWFLWTIEHTNRSLDNSNATFRPKHCMPDEARDGRNVAFELSSDLLVCSIVQRNHSAITIIIPKVLVELE